MHTEVLISSFSILATFETRTDHEAEHMRKAVKKLALAVLLPSPGVSDLRRGCTCTRRCKATHVLWTLFVLLAAAPCDVVPFHKCQPPHQHDPVEQEQMHAILHGEMQGYDCQQCPSSRLSKPDEDGRAQ